MDNDIHSLTGCDIVIHQLCSRKPSRASTVAFSALHFEYMSLMAWLIGHLLKLVFGGTEEQYLIVLQLASMAH